MFQINIDAPDKWNLFYITNGTVHIV